MRLWDVLSVITSPESGRLTSNCRNSGGYLGGIPRTATLSRPIASHGNTVPSNLACKHGTNANRYNNEVQLTFHFDSRDAMLAQYLPSSCVRPSVRLSVRPLQVSVLPRRLNLESCKQRRTIIIIIYSNQDVHIKSTSS